MSNPFSLLFTLKQHTPIIHFQHEQEGATLRATEVKPKLDRFIMEKLTGKIAHEAAAEFKRRALLREGEDAKPEWKNWLVGNGQHPALDYKVRINPVTNLSYFLPLPMSYKSRTYPDRDSCLKSFVEDKRKLKIELLMPTLYFGNADKINFKQQEINPDKTFVGEMKFAIGSTEDIIGQIRSSQADLLKTIEKHLPDLFLTENFGTRQNKGFGSFSVLLINGKTPISSPLNILFHYRTGSTYKQLSGLFQCIKDEYQQLKSGINKPYSKSKLFQHFINDETPAQLWEKRFLKNFINSNKISSKNLFFSTKKAPIDIEDISYSDYNDYPDKQPNNYGFVRALLGLAEQYEFSVFHSTGGIDFSDRYIAAVKHKPIVGGEKIERFKSPLFFKVIGEYIYLKYDQTFTEILNEEFEFALKLKTGLTSSGTNPSIRVPSNFDIGKFLKNNLSSKWTSKF